MSNYSYVRIKNIPEVLLCQPDSYTEMKKASPNDLPPSGWLKNKKPLNLQRFSFVARTGIEPMILP